MDPGGPTATIIERIITLEPENAFKIIGYFLLQDIEDCDLIQLAFGTDQSSPRNEFLDFSRNPNPLSPSLTSNTFGYNPDFRHEGSSQQQQQQWSNHFPFANLHQRSFSANEPGYQFLPGGLVDGFGSPGGLGSPSERISPNQQQRMIAAHGSPMSNIQGSGQFGVEGGFGSPSEQKRMIAPLFMGDFGSPMSNINFGPVVDVRIPNQERRMFGFVTFANAETVTTVLAQGNSHLIGESAQQQLNQLLERENLLHHPRLSGMDPRDQDESRFGPMMFRNPTQEMRQRRNVQADLQQAIEVEDQRRRLLNLKLPDMENKSIHHHQRSPSIASPAHFPSQVREGDSGIGEKDLEQVATSNEEHQGQERSLENTLPDSSFGSSNKSGQTSRV
ncbi:hypothetical protein ARALYDRAFT_314515 [Arabidopsis lyrata subsp. lyrata]|uniref:AtC3H46-like PABC-like domain-containing protein n=1 Tax=Arabidopsis lyrata subsp. lyrata TaxID=81972 RepID=D7KHT3_ARALL|nr:hypothetical protein ARALYDRAFT_314515 [Arabidopsis lyrata subsp. lyrata]